MRPYDASGRYEIPVSLSQMRRAGTSSRSNCKLTVGTLTKSRGQFQGVALYRLRPFLLSGKWIVRLLQSQPEGGYMDIPAQLKSARDKASFELGRLEAAVSALSGFSSKSSKAGKRRKMSASARMKISLAQKARWARRSNSQTSLRPKRHVSAASRRKMAAAQRARWARLNQRKAA